MVIVGIDEVGRGCLAGPVAAGAVILKQPIKGLKDSKLLSKPQREKLAAQIKVEALAFGIGWSPATEVDELGLTAAVRLAMERALAQIKLPYQQIIIDGNYNFLSSNHLAKTIVKADNTIPVVSAASIIAKVARDQYMCQMAVQHPDYGFDKHVGYGTLHHRQMLKKYGVCELHRRSFAPVLLQLAA